ncbi:hypothetical protein DSL72_002917 [Monilinia vaccinii-corymbosi]|uniref:Protein kinase domain-containing protein n=1 Tax=Monilinia vaccinii-corymbosi TaxID=61207 RepID=A0A8A3PE24_9HELO|nr:hypothetical protein DSL72_002917 [Monilinia vaccinii-corymbosi]
MYRRLQQLQGKFLPYFYGEAIYDDSPALVLSEIIGRRLFELEIPPEEDEEMERKLDEVYRALTVYHVMHGDPTLYNAMDIGDRIMLLDQEQSEIQEAEWENSTNKANVGYLMRHLQLNRQYREEERQRAEKARKDRKERRRNDREEERQFRIGNPGRRGEE